MSIHNGDFDSDDDVLAHRLMLAALNADEDAFNAVMAQLGCTHCSHRVIYALVDWLLGSVLFQQVLLHKCGQMFESAIRDVEDRLAGRLDDRWPDGRP